MHKIHPIMNVKIMSLLLLFLSISTSSCSQDKESPVINNNQPSVTSDDESEPNVASEKASIVSVTFSGNENNYNFSVGISSPDTGCEQYANWWEIITEDGKLVYRRILGHSHVNEQPFIRSGGVVPITANQTVIIRAHMNTSGYGTTVYKGSVSSGFNTTTLEDSFANDLESTSPLPSGCAF